VRIARLGGNSALQVSPRDTPPNSVILVLGTRIHEFACLCSVALKKLVDGRAKHDHDEKG
jgi:hypothetical protein